VGSYHFYRGSLRTIANSSCLASPARPVGTDLELLRPALLGLEMSDVAADYRSARVMKQGLSFLVALFLVAAAAVPEAAASGGVALLIGLMV
jgi:hypothetical protein